MSRSAAEQTGRASLVLQLDTRNMRAVSDAFGIVKPKTFPIGFIYFGYFNTSGVAAWSPKLDESSYKETRSYYSIKVNGIPLWTVRDLKDEGLKTPRTMSYSLKGVLNGVIKPSTTPYKIEIVKVCSSSSPGGSCDGVPDPADVFVSPRGYIAYSLWTSNQSLIVNGTYYRDHAWCPVQPVVNVP